MENHYKDGFWSYPEFAQKIDHFVSIIDSVLTVTNLACSTIRQTLSLPATILSNCLRKVAGRVVSMHASDRYLAEGTTIEVAPKDGTLGYSPNCVTASQAKA